MGSWHEQARHAYLQMYPELEPHFVASQYDDLPGALQTLGIEHATSNSSMGSLFHLVQTLPGMLPLVVGAVGGAIAALSALLLGVPPLGAITAAAVALVVVVAAMSISNRRSVETVAPSLMPRFPSPRE